MELGTANLEATTTRAQADEELRLALSMRGGVSLAVWIGGAVSEIETLRKAGSESESATGAGGVYRELLAQARYDSVSVDILSGASAGGLNGAIYAASLIYNFDFSEMSDLWLQVADIEALCRPTRWRPGEPKRPSLFEGDDYFMGVCANGLQKLISDAIPLRHDAAQREGKSPGSDIDRLDLFLAATLSSPVETILRNDSFSRIEETRSSAFFHFRHLGEPGSAISDFPVVESEAQAVPVAARLALAGRSSSSFPIAFEPASVWSDPKTPDVADGPPGAGPNMAGIFSEITDDERVGVIDGGVLDNIPVGRAIQAIAGAPAAGAASRWLLYLHPSPPESVRGSAMNGGLGGILSGLKTSIKLKFSRESLVEDMVELERHNAEVARRRITRERLLVTGSGQPRRSEAATAWASTDAYRIRTVLMEPDLAMATHPFLTRSFGNVLDSWTPVLRTALLDRLPASLEHTYLDGSESLPLIALGDFVEVLLTITQQVSDVDEEEASLYRVRLLVEVLHSIWEQCWASEAGDPPADLADLDGWIAATAASAMRHSESIPDVFAVRVVDGLSGANDEDFHAALQELHASRLDTDGDGDARHTLDSVWEVVLDHAVVLQGRSRELGDPVADALATLVLGDLGSLAPQILSTAPLHRRILSGESAIKFLRVSGANASPFGVWFEGGNRNGLSVTEKLAGNQLANFGAFFSARWRGNDWMWGRLDGATSLVDLLCDSTRWFDPTLEQPGQGADRDAEIHRAMSRLRAAVLTPFDNDSDHWRQWREEEWQDAQADVRNELVEASEDIRVARPLFATKRLLTRRLHAEHLAMDLPMVLATPRGAAPEPTVRPEPAESLAAVERLARRVQAGRETVPGDIEPERWARIGMRVGLNAWLALRPTGSVARVVSSLLKPIFVFLLSVLVYPRRALLSGIIGFAVLTLGQWGTSLPIAERKSWPWDGPWGSTDPGLGDYWTWQKGLAAAAVVVLAGLLSWVHLRSKSRSIGQLAAAAAGGAVGVATIVLALLDYSFPPILVPLGAILVVIVGMHWMSKPAWVGCIAVALAPYALLWIAVRQWDWMTPGWWALGSFAGAVGLTTIYVTLVDVFPSRPRPALAS